MVLNKTLIACTIVFAIALALRLYPTTSTGMPFSTDGWPFIKNCEIILEKTPVNIGDDRIFDGISNYWPAISFSGAIISETTSLPPVEAMATYMPLAGGLAVIIFYTTTKTHYGKGTAYIASLLFGTVFTHVYFTAGVTKETYANPLYLTIILILFNQNLVERKSTLAAFTILSIALAFTHHLTSVILAAIIISITLAKIIDGLKTGREINKIEPLLTIIFLTTLTLYFTLYANKIFNFTTADQILMASSFQVIAFALAAYLTLKPYNYSRNRAIISTAAAAAFTIATIIIILFTNFSPKPYFTPTVQRHILPYLLPYYLIIPFIVQGYIACRRTGSTVPLTFWLSAVAGLQAYSLFTSTGLDLTLWVRTPNFLYPPAAILAALGLHQTYEIGGNKIFQTLGKLTVIAVILATVATNLYSLHASVNLQDRYMGYHWLYTPQEYFAGSWASKLYDGTVAGDMKVSYLINCYYKLNVDVLQGYRYLAEEANVRPKLLFIYGQMFGNGYVLGLHGIELPSDWTRKLYELNQIYANGLTTLYAG